MATADHTERWLPVVGREGLYEVSDHGRVWSVERTVTTKRGVKRKVGGRVIKGGKLKSGHATVCLAPVGQGESEWKLVHRLVLEAFIGPCPDGLECCHYNDIPNDNRLANLSWESRRQNMLDRSRNGIDNNGTKGATHCKRGHEFNPDNTIVYKYGHRACRKCKNAAQRARRASAK